MSARALDQFYTARPVAKSCLAFLQDTIPSTATDLYLEPSAGDGAFFELMPPGARVGVDLEPKHPEVARQNFLEEFNPKSGSFRWITLGNPPFGKNSSLAVQFFNKAAAFSEVIAFVVPLTFRKQSLQKRLNRNFELVAELTLPPCAFVFEGEPYSVPCCFQVWQKVSSSRVHVETPLVHVDFDFCCAAEADFAIRRVGGLAGKVIREFSGYSPSSHYFVRSHIGAATLAARFEAIDWEDVKWNTAGNPSIGKRELVGKYAAICASEVKAKRPKRDALPV